MKLHVACLKIAEKFNAMSYEEQKENFNKVVAWAEQHKEYFDLVEVEDMSRNGEIKYYFVEYTNKNGEHKKLYMACFNDKVWGKYNVSVKWVDDK